MRHLASRTACSLWVLASLAGCAEERAHPQPPARSPTDKASVYGDAALIPTRAGERARAEVALAEEVRVALEMLHEVEKARITVSSADGSPGSAVIVVRTSEAGDTASLEATIRRIATAALGNDDVALTIEISTPRITRSDRSDPSPPEQNPWVLLAVLGLGISLGLTFDRGRRLLRRHR